MKPSSQVRSWVGEFFFLSLASARAAVDCFLWRFKKEKASNRRRHQKEKDLTMKPCFNPKP